MASDPSKLDPRVWKVNHRNNKQYAVCLICDDEHDKPTRELRHRVRHEQSQAHRTNVTAREQMRRTNQDRGQMDVDPVDLLQEHPEPVDPQHTRLMDSGLRAVLGSLYDDLNVGLFDPADVDNAPTHEEDQRFWHLLSAPDAERHDVFQPEARREMASLVGNLLRIHGDADSDDANTDDEYDFLSDSDDDSDEPLHEMPDNTFFEDSDGEDDPAREDDSHWYSTGANDEQGQGRARTRTSASAPDSQEWYPWPDKIMCTLDIVSNLPRSVFSQRQLDLFLWLLRINGVNDVPSVRSLKTLNERLQKLCGIDTIMYEGAHGNVFYVNDLAQIIAQEMANPRVRPHLSFYPEDKGPKLSEAKHGRRWHDEYPDDLAPPMIRHNGSDYYIFEPTLLQNHSEEYCVPVRWFERNKSLYAKCWKLIPDYNRSGWFVQKDEFEIEQSQLLMNFTGFCEGYSRYRLPSPRNILGVVSAASHAAAVEALPWSLTDPAVGNRWRALAKGRRVLAFPLWMYCDDTSGNVSKKWNKHNSFLFTPAGLARSETHKEYNIHFLCTSNLAAPLEMLDGIADQLDIAEKNGIAAYDSVYEEEVLVIPWTLALLGDNPMQSEFACHIGLRGKYFCRACKVMGKTRDRDAGRVPNVDEPDDEDEEGSNASDEDLDGERPKRRKFSESYDQVKARILEFIVPGTPRNGEASVQSLNDMFNEAAFIGSETRVKKMRTTTGLKDTYQQFFLDKLFKSHKRLRNRDKKDAALRSAIGNLPDRICSPVWRLKGLDPHHDTPVEILHVILLGFVKYMWRDVLKVQLKGKQAKLDELEHKLTSFDTSGLGISPLNGHTLVKYGLSLTGRDFRAIAQVAPFVLQGYVSQESYETWVCLSKLIPMVWMTEINDINTHEPKLASEIDSFLLLAAKWSARWFNKPKFHIIVHLPPHIRRFGPAILFATEAFESFNAVIRAKSVHSNRLAPSRDIALAFAQGNRIRHLLSGGKFRVATSDSEPSSRLVHCGPGPLRIVTAPGSTVAEYLGLALNDRATAGTCTDSKKPPTTFLNTVTGSIFPQHPIFSALSHQHVRFQEAQTIILDNLDRVEPTDFTIIRNRMPERLHDLGYTFIGRLVEVLRVVDHNHIGGNIGRPKPDSILVEIVHVSTSASPNYAMPLLRPSGQGILVEIKDILGTVSAPHDCVSNGCGLTGTREIYQERRKTAKTIPCMEHLRNPDARILNIAQMHNTTHLEPFRVQSRSWTALEREQIISESALKEAISQKKASKTVGERGFSRPNTPLPPSIRPPSTRPSTAARYTDMQFGGAPHLYPQPGSSRLTDTWTA